VGILTGVGLTGLEVILLGCPCAVIGGPGICGFEGILADGPGGPGGVAPALGILLRAEDTDRGRGMIDA
jgi:hypothetical protein